MAEIRYTRALNVYQQDLSVGIERGAADHYFEEHNLRPDVLRTTESGNSWSYSIGIGTEATFVPWCRKTKVNVVLDFDSVHQEQLQTAPGESSDRLKRVRIAKFADCL